MLKRICSLLIAVILMWNVPLTASAQTYKDTWAYSRTYLDAINYVSDNGYMIGIGNASFVPDGWMTRAMLVTILYSMAGKPECNNAIPFPDVKEDDWFYNPVRWAYEKGMTAGNGRGEFSPHSYILKQDAILILYKYAMYNNMTDVSMDYNLILSDMFADAESVSTYAMDAVAWAVKRDIYPIKNDMLVPKAKLDRANMALLLTAYGENVEHIVYGRDDYSFCNSADFFTEDYYYLTEAHWEQFATNLQRVFGVHEWVADIYITSILEKRNQRWAGSCYGMALTTILDKKGKIDFNGSFDPLAANMHAVKIQEGSQVESAINYYYLTQFVPFAVQPPTPKKIAEQGVLEELVEISRQEQGLKLFCYTMPNGSAHAVVAYDIEKMAEDVYRIKAYDNRDSRAALGGSNSAINITVDIGENTCTVHSLSRDEEVTAACMITNFDVYDLMDINAEEYDQPTYGGPATEKVLEIFLVELSGDFRLTNAEGKVVVCNDMQLSGDLNVVSYNLIYNGPDQYAQMVICVEGSEGYCYEPLTEGMTTKLSLYNVLGSASVVGENIQKAYIDSENNVEIE